MLGLPLIYLLLIHPRGQGFGLLDVAIALLAFSLAGHLPKRWVTHAGNKRRHAIELALPDTLDLLVVSMEAGLTLDGALAKVVEKTAGPLRDELRRTLHEIELGASRRDSLRRLGSRTGVKDLVSLINSIVQADQMGVSMAHVMRTQASEARLKRRQRAEERAHQAAVKMLFPLVVCILPSVMIVTVGPAALAIYAQFSKGLFG
ncbi:MAG: type II secretion system F family protein [Chloroflexota bacterium]